MDIDDPLDEESSGRVFYFGWKLYFGEVVGLDEVCSLNLLHVVVDIRSKLRNHLGVPHVEVDAFSVDHLLAELLPVADKALLEDSVDGFVCLH